MNDNKYSEFEELESSHGVTGYFNPKKRNWSRTIFGAMIFLAGLLITIDSQTSDSVTIYFGAMAIGFMLIVSGLRGDDEL